MLAPDTKVVVTPGASPSPQGSLGWSRIAGPVQPFLDAVADRLAQQVQAFDPAIANFAQYALTNQGKQLRPTLVALSGASVGQMNDGLITVAVIIEMVHLATLVHDDVMDEAEIRRCRPTLAANWGNEISVLLGDCLFAHSLKLAASFPTPEVCRAVSSSTNTVCAGEIRQTLQRRHFGLSREDYFKVLEMKTGELFSLSCDLGARLGGGSVEERTALRRYGLALGTAYQVYDDCLDVFGSEAMVGKSLGTDLASGKLTLPVLVVFERGTEAEQARLKELILQWQPAHHGEVLLLLEKYDALEESRRVIAEYLDTARKALKALPDSDSREGLKFLTEFLARQTDALGVAG